MHTATHKNYTVRDFIWGGRKIFVRWRRYFVALAVILSAAQMVVMLAGVFTAWGMLIAWAEINLGVVFGLVLGILLLIAAYMYVAFFTLYLVKNLSLNHPFTLQSLAGDAYENFRALLLTALQKWIYTIGLFILLIIPGIIYSVYRAFTQFINVYEGKFYGDSLGRSTALITWRRWKTLGNLFVISLLAVIILGVLSSLLGVGDVNTGEVMMNTSTGMMWGTSTNNDWMSLLRGIVSGVVSYLFMCILAKMYLAYKETAGSTGHETHHTHTHAAHHTNDNPSHLHDDQVTTEHKHHTPAHTWKHTHEHPQHKGA